MYDYCCIYLQQFTSHKEYKRLLTFHQDRFLLAVNKTNIIKIQSLKLRIF